MNDHDTEQTPTSPPEGAQQTPEIDEAHERHDYWQTNIRYLLILLAVWFAVSYGAGILFVDQLNKITLPGSSFKLGFWFAQQGSIYCFVILIAIYVVLMNKLDKRFHVQED